MILAEAVLGYLTVGVGPPQASWGRMLQEAEHYLGARPLLVGAPALAMVLAVLGFTRVGEGLSQALDGRSPAQRATAPADPVLLAVLLVAIAAFSGSESISSPLARPPRSETNTLRIATSVSVTSLDPAVANDEATRSIDQLLYARLVTWNERGELVPDLTERFSIEDEGKRFRFVLKPDLVFHDLSPLVAADVKRSLERTLSPRTPCPAATAFSGLVGYDAFRRGEAPGIAGITTPGPLEVVMTLTDADASFISLLGLGFAAPVCEGGGDHAGPKGRPPCGAGPFRLARLDERQIVLDRFPRYHRAGAPKLDRIECDLGVAPITQRYRFERGDIDVIAELTGIDTERMAADERWQAYQGWLVKPTVQGLFLNTTMAPFDNRHVRRAVSLALEPSILSRIRPSLRPIDRILPEGIARPAEAPGRRHDLAAALEEMRLGGYAYDAASGSGGYPHAIDYWTTPGSLDQTVAEVYQQQLARIGIRIRLKLVSYASWLSAISTPRTVAMGWRPWQPDFPDPSAMIDATLTSGAISNQGTQNLAFFSNAEVDRLAEQAHREGDPQRRMAMYARIEEIVRDEAPWIPTYTSHILVVWQPYVRGFRPDPMMPWRLDQVSIGEVP
jgi:ABC-type transport system substrate-binding protein